MKLKELKEKVDMMCAGVENLDIPVYILLNDLERIEDISIEDGYVLIETE